MARVTNGKRESERVGILKGEDTKSTVTNSFSSGEEGMEEKEANVGD